MTKIGTHQKMQTVCEDCGKRIVFVPFSRTNYKWVTNPKRYMSWHCDVDPQRSVKSHRPPAGQVYV